MSKFHYLQLDVFAASRGGGNPLGVVIDARDFSDADMQAFAAWTNLVETTFLLPPRNPAASYRLRIFTPAREIPFAGHPTIGSAHAALQSGFAQPRAGELVQECGAGLLPIRIDGAEFARELLVQAPDARVVPAQPDPAPLAAALRGCRPGSLPPALVEGGRRWWIAEFADEDEVRRWRPDHAAVRRLADADACLGLCVFARCAQAGYDLVVRALPAGVDIAEDPASGAANGLIAAYLAASEPDGPLARGYRVSQGREIGHDAAIRVRIDAEKRVWVGGRTDTIVDGTLSWPLSTPGRSPSASEAMDGRERP